MTNKLKIGYFADGPWAHQAFQLIIKDPTLIISFIVPRTDTTDATLKNYAEGYNIPYLKEQRINSEAFYEISKQYNCDLFVSMSFNQIFKGKIINLPKHGTINCHAGKLPFYKGRNVLNWVLINDEKEFGITVHYINEGIDTGDIIIQKTFSISDEDDYNTLLKTAYKECAISLYEAIKLFQVGHFKTTSQSSIHKLGFYCGQRGLGDEVINWNQTSRELFNFIRAICYPGPKAHTTLNGENIIINKVRMIDDALKYKCTNGQIVGKTKDGFIVKTLDTTIEILEIETISKLKIGDRLGT